MYNWRRDDKGDSLHASPLLEGAPYILAQRGIHLFFCYWQNNLEIRNRLHCRLILFHECKPVI